MKKQPTELYMYISIYDVYIILLMMLQQQQQQQQ